MKKSVQHVYEKKDWLVALSKKNHSKIMNKKREAYTILGKYEKKIGGRLSAHFFIHFGKKAFAITDPNWNFLVANFYFALAYIANFANRYNI